jgi:spermidine synthase
MLLALFVGSGCSALIYEVVWFQQLSLVLGASAISLAILLTSFMGGMCLGSVALPYMIPGLKQH